MRDCVHSQTPTHRLLSPQKSLGRHHEVHDRRCYQRNLLRVDGDKPTERAQVFLCPLIRRKGVGAIERDVSQLQEFQSCQLFRYKTHSHRVSNLLQEVPNDHNTMGRQVSKPTPKMSHLQ